MRKRIALGAAVLLIAGAMASMPARADQKEGWFVFLEGIDTQVTNAAQPMGTVVTFGDPFGDPSTPDIFDHRFVDWGSNVTGRVGFGKQWANGNKLTLSYWVFDNDESNSLDLSTVDGFYSPLGYQYYYSATPGSFSRSDANIKASSIDVDFSHVHSVTDHFDFEWTIGMKFASYEDTLSVETGYTYTYTDGTQYEYFERENFHNNSDMWGFKAGARGTYNFGPKFSLTAGLNLSKVMGDLESTIAVDVVTIIPNNGTTTLHGFEDHAKDDNRSGTIGDYDIMGVFHLGEHFDLGVGFEHSTWQGISTDLLRSHFGLENRDDVGFTGWKVGGKWRFGGGS